MAGTYQDFLDAIRFQESSDRYDQVNPGRFLGAYQLGEAVLTTLGYVRSDSNSSNNDYSGGWTGLNGINSRQDFLDSHEVQDQAVKDHFSVLWQYIRNYDDEFYTQQTLNGVFLTRSGMLAGAHLVGVGALDRFIKSGGFDIALDGNGKSIVDYINQFADYAVPQSFVSHLGNDNTIKGGRGNDILQGWNGNDILWPGGGDDEIWGGRRDNDQGIDDGFDTVSYADSGSAIRLTFLGESSDYLMRVRDGTGGTDRLHSIENIIGSKYRDTFIIGGIIQSNALGNVFLSIDANDGQGGSIRDSINLNQSYGALTLYIGPDANGEIISQSTGGKILLAGFHTSIVGSNYDDQIQDVSSGHKQIDGGEGNDTISVGGDGALLFGGGGNDTLTGGDGNDLLDGGYGANLLAGGGGSDWLIARGSNDILDGGDGADYLQTFAYGATLIGGAGNDLIDVSAGSQTTIKFGPNSGHDYVVSSLTSAQLNGFETPSILIELEGIGSGDVSYIFSNQSLSGEFSAGVGSPLDIPGLAWIRGDLTIRVNSTGATLTIQNALGLANFQTHDSGATVHHYSGNIDDLINIQPNLNITFGNSGIGGGIGLPGDPPAEPRTASLGDISGYTTALEEYVAATATSSADTTGTPGDDSLTGGLGSDTLTGGAGDDEFTTSGGDDNIDGGDGRDTLVTLGSSWQFVASFDNAQFTLTDNVGSEGKLALSSIEAIEFIGDSVTMAVLIGTAESETIEAQGSAIVFGAAGDDTLIASNDPSQLFGGSGSDHLVGGDSWDTLTGGSGADLIEGGAGSDRYLWSLGDGNDTIVDATGTDEWNDLTLQSVRSFEATLSQDGDDLLITTARSGEVIRIKDQLLADASHGLEGIAFSNGQYWDRAAILQHLFPTVIEGSSGDDTLSGTDASELFVGGQGDDTIVDSAGDDIYQWTLGDGADLITNGSGWASQTDAIALGAGINASDIIVRHELGGQDRLSFSVNSGGSVTVDGVTSGDNREVLIRFADGTVWDEATLLRKADENPTLVTGTSGSDSLDGSSRADLIDGLTGNDTLDGADGSDIYVYRSGDGNDLIRDYGSALDRDVLNLLDLTRGQVTLSRVNDAFGNGNDLLVTDHSTGQAVRVVGQFANAGIEEIRFADDVVLDLTAIQAETSQINGSAGNDYFNLNWSGFVLDPGAGDDVITVNRTGSGTILFGEGYGHDRLQSALGAGFARTDTLYLQGLNPDDVTLTRASNGLSGDGLTVTVNATGDTFNAIWQFNGYDEQAGLEYIHFADGTQWSRADIAANVIG